MSLGGERQGAVIVDTVAIRWDSPIMWSILEVLGNWMLTFVKGILDIAMHG
jgi:hypothetical protein